MGVKKAKPVEKLNILKSSKKNKNFYLSTDVINFVKDEAKRLSNPKKKIFVSENAVLTAIVEFYRSQK